MMPRPTILYRPILKGKQGEFKALKALTDEQYVLTSPLVEPVLTGSAPFSSVKFAKAMADAWPINWPFYVDPHLVGVDETEAIADELSLHSLQMIPVVHDDGEKGSATAARGVARAHKQGVAIRIGAQSIGDPGLVKRIEQMLGLLRHQPATADLFLDLESFSAPHANLMVAGSVAAIEALAQVGKWRSITLAGSSFPETLSGLKADTITTLPRTEWQAWLRVRAIDLPARVDFGDYGIAHPNLPDVDPRFMNMSANLRYTTDAGWLVFKGKGVKKKGFGQFNGFCRRLVNMPEFSGDGYSWGDTQIVAMCGAGSTSGNATTWRQIGTNHHITLVTAALANLRDS